MQGNLSGRTVTAAIRARSTVAPRPSPTHALVGSVFILGLAGNSLPAGAQTNVLSIVRPPAVTHHAGAQDRNHPPPAPFAAPRRPAIAGPAAAPLPKQLPPEAQEEDTRNLVENWKRRRTPQEYRTMVEHALKLPPEPHAGTRNGRGAIITAAVSTSAWAQLGAGDINNDGVHHQSGRARASAYAWDNSQGATVLWVGTTGGGVWRSILLGIFGAVFVPVSDTLPGSPSVGAFLVHPNDSSQILIGTGDSYRYGGSGLYKSTDSGATWTAIAGNWPSAFQKIIDDYNDSTGNTVVAEGDSGIWRSQDFGSNWTQVYSGSTSDLVQDPNYAWIWYAGAPGTGVLRSTDYGNSFAPIGSGISTPIGRVSVAVSAAASWHVYALTEGNFGALGGIWRSDDYGDGTWNALESTDNISWGQAFHTCAIGVDPTNADRLFVGMGGLQWTENATAGTPTWNYNSDGGHADFTSFNFEQGTTNVIITNDGGVYNFDYSANSVSGTLNELGLNCQQTMEPVDCLAGSRTVPDLLLAGLQDNGMIRIDKNDNPPILELGGGDGGAASISPDDPNILVFSSGEAYNRYYSTDQGSSWVGINFFLPHNWVPTVMIDQTPSNGFTPYIYTYSDLYVWYKAVEPNNDWAAANSTPLPNGYNPRGMDASNDTAAYVFYIESWGSGELYVMDSYSDGSLGSMGWEQRTPPLPLGSWDNDCQIAADRSSLRPYTVTYCTGASRPSRAFISNDRGQTWTDVTGDLVTKLPDASYMKLIANPGDQTQLFLATDAGVLRSDNGGANWYRYMAGLPAVESVPGMELNYDNSSPPLLHIGTYGRGFWERQVGADAVLASVTLSRTQPIGGVQNSTGTVNLDRTAPSAITINLSSSDPAASVPGSVTVASGASSATFTVTTTSVNSPTPGAITATYNEVSPTANITVEPIGVHKLTLSPTSLIAGTANSTGTVELNAKAPAGGLTVALTTSSGHATVPASISIPTGAASGTFTVTTTGVSKAAAAKIAASANSLSSTAKLTLEPDTPTGLTLSRTTAVGGYQTAKGTVTLAVAAPATGVKVTLTSSAPSVASVPASIKVAGGAVSGAFKVTTYAVATATTVTITATAGGVSKPAVITVEPDPIHSLTLNPTTVQGGVANSTGTVTLAFPAPSGGITVMLSSSNTAAATVLGSVSVVTGMKTATFTVTTSKVTASTTVTIKAATGGTSKSAPLTVTP